MATNKSTIQVLKKASDLIDELNAINRYVLKPHISAQKKQNGQFPNDYYVYIKSEKRYKRMP